VHDEVGELMMVDKITELTVAVLCIIAAWSLIVSLVILIVELTAKGTGLCT